MLALSGILALAGCQNRAERAENPDQPPGAPAATETRRETGEAGRDAGQAVEGAVEGVAQAGENAVLTAKVKNALIIARDMDTSNLNVDSQDGVVTLKGSVPTTAMKQRAERLARQVEGVQSVRNELTVAAPANANR